MKGISLLTTSNFDRVATRANLISLVENLESKDDRCSSIFSPVSSSSPYFFCLRLMSSMLTQLIWYAGNLVDLWGLLKSSCLANFISNNKGDDNNNVIDHLLNGEELVVVNVNVAEPTDIKGDKGTSYLMEAEQK
jgi:hypothetical protein